MKKTLFILVFLLSFFLTITYCYASEDDILQGDFTYKNDELQDDIKEDVKEEVIEKDEFSEYNRIVYSKATVKTDNAENANYISFIYPVDPSSSNGVSVYDVPLGYYYQVRIYSSSLGSFILPSENTYYIRGQEQKGVNYVNTTNFYIANPPATNGNNYVYFMSESDPNSITPTPTPTPEPTPEVSVSWNSVSENLIRIEERLINIEGEINQFKDIYVSQNEVVSNNIIKKRISDYTTSESLSLIGLMLGFVAGLVYLIHKTIFKWG